MQHPADRALAEAARRRDLVLTLASLMSQGHSQASAAALMGESAATLSRYRRAYEASGFDALLPEHRCSGRKPLAELTEAEQHAVQALTLRTDTATGKQVRCSVSLALRLYAHSEACRPELREAILKPRRSKHTLTRTLKQQARTTPELRQLDRGEKDFRVNSFWQPRDLTYIDAGGQTVPLVPGSLFESDDMTFNEPCYVEWDDPADPCAARYGVRAFRAQLLPWLDIGSASFRAYSIVFRYSDAYRARDIRWAVYHLFRSVGMPQALRLERGAWDSKAVNALATPQCRIFHANTPNAKFIENRFNTFQKLMSLEGVRLGRHRGEFEEGNKAWTAVRQGRLDPRQAGFHSLEELTAKIEKSFAWLNTDPMEGEIYGPRLARERYGLSQWVPEDIWQLWTRQHPLPQPDAEQAWHLMPERREVTLRAGLAKVRCEEVGATYYFHHERFAELGTGHRVTVCFDPANPEQAAILNAEPRQGARNRLHLAEGERLCVATLVERAPQFSLAQGESFYGGTAKRYTKLCRLLYRQLKPYGLQREKTASADHLRDGRGDVVEVSRRGDMQNAKCKMRNGEEPTTCPAERDKPPTRQVSPFLVHQDF